MRSQEPGNPHVPPGPMPARPSRLKGVLLRVGAVALGVLAAALVAEIGLRLGGYSRSYLNPLGSFHRPHPLVGYLGKPNFAGQFRTSEFNALIAHDANGFRRQEYQNPRAESQHQVLVFGDSFVWGWGVGQGEVFTDQMSRRMPGYYVMNFGLNGSGTVQQYALFEAFGVSHVEPGDTVLLTFFGNDFNDNLEGMLRAKVKDGKVTQVGPIRQMRPRPAVKDWSYAANLVIYAADRLTRALRQRRSALWAREWVKEGARSDQMIVATYYLRAFQRACADHRARFVVAYIPGQAELGETYRPQPERLEIEQAYRHAFFAAARSLGIPTIDLLPAFNAAHAAAPHDRLTFPHDEHWTAHGHAVAAEAIAHWILDADRSHE